VSFLCGVGMRARARLSRGKLAPRPRSLTLACASALRSPLSLCPPLLIRALPTPKNPALPPISFDIEAVDSSTQAITFAGGGFQEGRGGGMRTQPFFVEGEALALDSPGEWWIEPPSTGGEGRLHLWPNSSDASAPSLLILPVVRCLLLVFFLSVPSFL